MEGEIGSWGAPTARSVSRVGGTTRDRVAHELRSQILLGERRPGDRIDLDELAEEFGVSRTPIREACLALALDKLVRMAPRSGVTVIGVSRQDLQDNFALMSELAGVAAWWAAGRATADDLVWIRESRDQVAKAVHTGQSPNVANYDFHRAINRASHSARLSVLIAQTARLFPSDFFEAIPQQIPCSLPEHDEIVRAIEERDATRAKSLTQSHFQQAAQLLDLHMGGHASAQDG